MSVAEEPSLTFEEYLAWEERQPRRHEFVAGHVYLMAGGSERHDLAAQAVFTRLLPGTRQRGCRLFIGNRKVRTRAASYYPDVVAVCAKAADRQYETEPVLVVEVLSASTESVDRREKAMAFAELPSMAVYVLVDPDRRRIEVGEVLGGTVQWSVFGPGHVVHTAFGDLDVDELYDEVDAIATT
jgi:Uma2 family endonuclease